MRLRVSILYGSSDGCVATVRAENVDKSYWDQIKDSTYSKLASLAKTADPSTISPGQYVILCESIVREVSASDTIVGCGKARRGEHGDVGERGAVEMDPGTDISVWFTLRWRPSVPLVRIQGLHTDALYVAVGR